MKTLFSKLGLLSAITIFLLSFNKKPGGDIIEVYLNNKLMFKQFVHMDATVKGVSLDQSNAKDELTVMYSHCGTVGKERMISLKDDKNKILKQWKFENAWGKKNTMSIKVKEILDLEKSTGGVFTLVYSSKELPEGRAVVSLNRKGALAHL
jgi:hypothetical protein